MRFPLYLTGALLSLLSFFAALIGIGGGQIFFIIGGAGFLIGIGVAFLGYVVGLLEDIRDALTEE